jgi:hypothetical protein
VHTAVAPYVHRICTLYVLCMHSVCATLSIPGWCAALTLSLSCVVPRIASHRIASHAQAVSYLRRLLSLRSPYLPKHRPRWWNRLTIDLAEPANMNLPAEAWEACREALTDPWLEVSG